MIMQKLIIVQYEDKKMISQEMKNKVHFRNTDFFLKNYKNAQSDIDMSKVKDVVDVQLQCLGYGVFNQKQLLDNFIQYVFDFLKIFDKKSIRSFKLILNGFTLNSSQTVLAKLAENIQRIKQNLNVLWIHTSNLKDVTLKDFTYLLRLNNKISDINFEQYSLQCANWTFTPNQPTFSQLESVFTSLVQQARDPPHIQNKRFRLEISGWYYTLKDAKAFLEQQKVIKFVEEPGKKQKDIDIQRNKQKQQQFAKQLQKFTNQMEQFVKQLISVMDNVEQLDIDMRNYNQILKMKNLKKRLDNITKENRSEKSIISKRVDVQADQAEKQFNLNVVV